MVVTDEVFAPPYSLRPGQLEVATMLSGPTYPYLASSEGDEFRTDGIFSRLDVWAGQGEQQYRQLRRGEQCGGRGRKAAVVNAMGCGYSHGPFYRKAHQADERVDTEEFSNPRRNRAHLPGARKGDRVTVFCLVIHRHHLLVYVPYRGAF